MENEGEIKRREERKKKVHDGWYEMGNKHLGKGCWVEMVSKATPALAVE